MCWLFLVSRGGPESLEYKRLCKAFHGTDSSSVSFGHSPSQFQCAQMCRDTVEKWIIRFNLGIPPGSFVAVGGWVHDTALPGWFWLSLCFLVCARCYLSPVMLDEEVLCNSVLLMLGDGAHTSCSSGQAVAAKISPFLSAVMMMRRCSSVRKKFPSKMIPEMRPTSPT